MRLVALCLAGLAALAACTPRPDIAVSPAAAQVGTEVPVYVGTTRRPGGDAIFQSARGSQISYARIDVSIPPGHQPGQIEMTARAPDPAQHFMASHVAPQAGADAFRAELAGALARRSPANREVLIYVHGFNNTFADGVFRTAQIGHDFDMPGVMVHYSWPSSGRPLGYAYDRDSVLFARDGLVALIEEVNRAGARRVLLVGHSLGAHLSMEALRQLSLKRGGSVAPLVDGVILISPDIDVDVFRSQARTIGHLPQPFVIFASQRDRALALSARLSGESNRLGNLDTVQKVADLEVVVIDVSAYAGGDWLNHLTIAQSPALIRLFSNIAAVEAAFSGDMAGRTGLLPGTVLTVQDATAIILSPVSSLVQ
ncbi:alpha/beta fold hydrolase [Actibacterium sp. MT2.3-13A]|uniref:alpha/beta hydrolase n=1 Tax=Actibacterium sp. MT2.3-13A TaxID=2828332 RepID=UPI001BA48FEF|nr:alpha/beta fold hydrolase [Actibacterium sp. MT2.3-13A]